MTTTVSPMPKLRWRLFTFLAAAILVTGLYLVRFVGPYLSFDPGAYGYFWPWRYALWAHLGAGVVALLIGPVQIWLGITRQRLSLHRTMGRIYLGAELWDCRAPYYLIAHEIAGDWCFPLGACWVWLWPGR